MVCVPGESEGLAMQGSLHTYIIECLDVSLPVISWRKLAVNQENLTF